MFGCLLDPGCISNNSIEWLLNNYGQFSGLVPLRNLFNVNKYFNPVSEGFYSSFFFAHNYVKTQRSVHLSNILNCAPHHEGLTNVCFHMYVINHLQQLFCYCDKGS